MRKYWVVVLSVVMFGSLAVGQTTKPVAAVERVVIISVDGLRPDLAMRADCPTLRALMKRGSYSLWARTIPEAITLPSHTSMITGVSSRVHGINWNDDRPVEERRAVKVPTLFTLAKQAGLTTAMAAGKNKFITLADDGSVDYAAVPGSEDKRRAADPDAQIKGLESYKDSDVAAAAAQLIASHRPNVLLVHFGETDRAGHSIGWGTPEQIATIEKADAAVGVVVRAVETAGLLDSTVFIISADHGGQGRTHGKDDARSRHIPWIIAGPGIRQDLDLTRFKELNIDTQDTFATACWLLGIPMPAHTEGKPITQILAEQELLAPATQPATQPAY
jgi:predicted AlkP superfamily pyrophosphatase or phosphodiesterase